MRPHRRYPEEEKKVLLATVERAREESGQPVNWILSELGLTRSVYYDWLEVSALDSYSRYIVHWELALSMRAQEVAEIIATALEKATDKKPRIVRDNGSQFVAKEWREVIRHFGLEEIPIRVRHPESNGRIERYHRSVREEAFSDAEVEDLYRARELLAEWVRYYNEERLHSALKYLRPVDYYRGNPEALLADRKRKLREAAARRREVNKWGKLRTIADGLYHFAYTVLSEND